MLKTIEVYTAKELYSLNYKSFCKAYDKFVESTEFIFLEEVREEFKYYLKENYSLENIKLYWNLEYCQGAGVNFSNSIVFDKEELNSLVVMPENLLNIEFEAGILHNVLFSYSFLEDEEAELVENYLEKCSEVIDSICKELLEVGRELLDDLSSEETFISESEFQELIFTINGETV